MKFGLRAPYTTGLTYRSLAGTRVNMASKSHNADDTEQDPVTGEEISSTTVPPTINEVRNTSPQRNACSFFYFL